MIPLLFFFFTEPATTEIYTLSLHDALPIFSASSKSAPSPSIPLILTSVAGSCKCRCLFHSSSAATSRAPWLMLEKRSEEHTSELQSRGHLVCRLLLEKKKKKTRHTMISSAL